MNRPSIYVSVMLLLILVWLTFRDRATAPVGDVGPAPSARTTPISARPTSPRASSLAAKALTPVRRPAPAGAARQLAPPLAAKPHDPHTPPPPRSVPFRLIGEFVVAYGDVLLGKPKSTDFPAAGFIEAPPIRYWDQGVIPFSIHESLPDPQRVLRVIAYFNENTPLHFVPYQGQADSLVFLPLAGECLSYLGRSGGAQPVYLDDRCGDHEITHELMHALGFIHEHSRVDRDQYVQVNWQNIEPERREQFDLTPLELNEPVEGRPFDYHSVMIYPNSAFALDRAQPTLLPRGETAIEPTAHGLSPEDLERVRKLYLR